jgi:5-methylcytosine-specific restriction protein B
VLSDDDPYWILLKQVVADGFGGLILSGPPGTSKSWYADLLATKLAGDPVRVRAVQFHPAYQYEDFVEGYIPNESGTSFERVPKHLLLLGRAAEQAPDKTFVLVVDELSRADPARVFGEALTYIEASKRGRRFYLASGAEVSLPPNLFIIGTMNEFDRGVDEVDAAFDRRMARVAMRPEADLVAKFLADADMESELADKVLAFFNTLQRSREPAARVGHAFFVGLSNEADLARRWLVQLSHVLTKAFGLDTSGFREVETAWNAIFKLPEPALAEAPESFGLPTQGADQEVPATAGAYTDAVSSPNDLAPGVPPAAPSPPAT